MTTSTAPRSFRRTLPVSLLLIQFFIFSDLPAQQPPAESGLREEARVRLRTVRLRIESKVPENSELCRALDLNDLKVVLRGEPVETDRLIELDRERKRALHVLLLDTSRSIEDWLDYVRDAAATYVDALDPKRDRAMLATFDDSLVLVHPPTSDMDALREAIRDVRMGTWTSMVDGLYYVMRELEGRPERPVVILLTDGVDSASLHDRADVNKIVDSRPDLIAFTVGLDTPLFSHGLPPGWASSKRFLQRFAGRADGRWLDHPTGFRLRRAFDDIQDMLNAEAVLTFVDPDPEAEPGKIRVSSEKRACRVVTYAGTATVQPEERHLPIESPWPEPSFTLPLVPDPKYRIEYIPSRDKGVDPICGETGADGIPIWHMKVQPGLLVVCALDIIIEEGPLYDYYSPMRSRFNAWLEQNTRPLLIEVPALDDLPRGPDELMDSLARFALSLEGKPVKTGDLQVPVERHARPYHDWPGLCNGKVFFHLRSRLARGLFAQPEYRRWVLDRLAEEAQRGIGELKERFRDYAPQFGDDELEEVARLSEEGRAILARAEAPSEVDLQRHLAAWLGDVSAAELFRRWEQARLDRLLESDGAEPIEPFLESWTALRQVFFVPSYARVLTLLDPVHDRETDRIGYWRVVLPRPSWFGQRVKGWKNRVDYSDLPMDLIPDRPLALELIGERCEQSPTLCEHLRGAGYRVESIDYELLGRPWKQSPERAFRQVLVRIELAAPEPAPGAGERPVLRLSVEYDRSSRDEPPRPVAVELDVEGDRELAELARAWR